MYSRVPFDGPRFLWRQQIVQHVVFVRRCDVSGDTPYRIW